MVELVLISAEVSKLKTWIISAYLSKRGYTISRTFVVRLKLRNWFNVPYKEDIIIREEIWEYEFLGRV